MSGQAGASSGEIAEHPLEDVLDEAIEASHGETICLDDLLQEFGTRSFGPVLIVLSLVIISPIGSIPALPIALGAVIALFAVQLVFGRARPWLPHRLRKVGIDRGRAERFRERWQDRLERIDAMLRPRFEWAAAAPSQWFASFCLIFLSATMIPLELIPFGATVPAVAMLFFGIGLTVRDGLMMLLGFVVTVPSLWLTFAWWPWGG